MAFSGDYHTHTVYSHGKGTIEENVLEAIKKGLREIAITDHGFRHMAFNVRRMDFAEMRKEVDDLRQKYPQINIYLGLETNVSSRKGKADLRAEDLPMLDLIVCGYHKFVLPDRLSDFFSFFVPNLVLGSTQKSTKKMIVRNTDAYLKLIENVDVDILSHLNYGIKADALEVARACKAYGTYVELNGKRVSLTDGEIEKMAEEGVRFIVDSDAHSVERVGEFSHPVSVIERIGLSKELIANWDKLPRFRSRIKRGLYADLNADGNADPQADGNKA